MKLNLLLVVGICAFLAHQSTGTVLRWPVCQTQACYNYADMLNNNLDRSVKPCDDFFQYSCGGYLARTTIAPEDSSTGVYRSKAKENRILLSKLLAEKPTDSDDRWTRNVKNYFSSCVNLSKSSFSKLGKNNLLLLDFGENKEAIEEFTEPYAKKVLDEELGGWPLVTGKDNPLSTLELIKRLLKYGQISFVSIETTLNPRKPDYFILKASQPGGTPVEFYQRKDFEAAYKNFYVEVAGYLNPDRPLNEVEKDVDDMFDLSRKIAKVQLNLAERRTGVNNLEMTLAELQEKVPKYPWIDVVKYGIFGDKKDIVITEQEPISVDHMKYLLAVQDIFADYAANRPRVLQNYMIGTFFYGKLNDNMPPRYQMVKMPLTKILTGVSVLPERGLLCGDRANNVMPNEVGKIFVSAFFSKEAKKDVKVMAQNLLKEFMEIIDEADWMEDGTKAKAIDKALFLNPQIGYSNYLDNATYLATKYTYEMDPNNLVKNVLTLSSYGQNEEANYLRTKVDRDMWFTSTAVMNAFYLREQNQMFIVAGILKPPFYDIDLPSNMVYGSIGFVMGHEITHGFDSNGRKHDRYGRYFSDDEEGLWDKATVDHYKEKAQCIVKQFSDVFVPEIQRNLNGVSTLTENIADNGGAKIAFRTYQKYSDPSRVQTLPGLDFTPDQLFFLAFSQPWCTIYKNETLLNLVLNDPHTPAQYRIRKVAENSPYFRKAFFCDDSQRNLVQCNLW